jgi:pilus assembly protein TadC
MAYPRLFVKRRVNDMERNLLPGLKHIYIQLKSGVPVYSSFISLSQGGYGALSEEFSELVKSVETGGNSQKEMDKMALRNPSPYLRRAIWQISNGMKAGSDMSNVLNTIIDNISKEQTLAVRRYGSQLNPLTLVYMMMAVIIPALGITMLIVLSSFSGMQITETMLLAILFGLGFMQFMYIGIIKSKRPNI